MKTLLFIFLFASAFAIGAAETPPYAGYEQDRGLLRDTERLPAPPINASSGKACAAAYRLFRNVIFTGLPRERVLAILGDPKTISDYGIPADPAPDSPLRYRFDSGLGGWEYVIEFQRGIVTSVKANSLE